MQHWIEFLPAARAFLAAIILTGRAVLIIRAVYPTARHSTVTVATAHAPTPATPTTGAHSGDAQSAHPDRMSHNLRLLLQIAQTATAGLALLYWLNKIGLL